MTESRIRVVADGSCVFAPGTRGGPGGWAAIVIDSLGERVYIGDSLESSSAVMEFKAATEGLRMSPRGARVDLISDYHGVKHALERREEGTAPRVVNGRLRLPRGSRRRMPRNAHLYVEFLEQVEELDVRLVIPEDEQLVALHARAHVLAIRRARELALAAGINSRHRGPRPASGAARGYTFSPPKVVYPPMPDPVKLKVREVPPMHLPGCTFMVCVVGCPVFDFYVLRGDSERLR